MSQDFDVSKAKKTKKRTRKHMSGSDESGKLLNTRAYQWQRQEPSSITLADSGSDNETPAKPPPSKKVKGIDFFVVNIQPMTFNFYIIFGNLQSDILAPKKEKAKHKPKKKPTKKSSMKVSVKRKNEEVSSPSSLSSSDEEGYVDCTYCQRHWLLNNQLYY